MGNIVWNCDWWNPFRHLPFINQLALVVEDRNIHILVARKDEILKHNNRAVVFVVGEGRSEKEEQMLVEGDYSFGHMSEEHNS